MVFYNNILLVVGYNRSELVAVHLVKTYCVPSLFYGCEARYMSSNDYHRLNVIMEQFILQDIWLLLA